MSRGPSVYKRRRALKLSWDGKLSTGFVHVTEGQVQGLFKDFRGHESRNSRTNGLKNKLWKEVGNHKKLKTLAGDCHLN